MESAERYVDLAKGCEQLAADATCEKNRQCFLAIAAMWRALAARSAEEPPEGGSLPRH